MPVRQSISRGLPPATMPTTSTQGMMVHMTLMKVGVAMAGTAIMQSQHLISPRRRQTGVGITGLSTEVMLCIHGGC